MRFNTKPKIKVDRSKSLSAFLAFVEEQGKMLQFSGYFEGKLKMANEHLHTRSPVLNDGRTPYLIVNKGISWCHGAISGHELNGREQGDDGGSE